ncbi:MAG: anion transporter [Meiothermus sp.]|uniref:anion transporter n=1 Tax=Meiothermus sp. TaxID=1955249 RepID=UPI0025EB0B52|nr:anion transporter [Meiothermus sp.]MCS7057801.1 anion transporter [Meiothermus sp.]MCS7194644.1 anion transporter [Meiothermus sp.]MDW8090947.1 anion transporter [Meiothermus sp.]MDW8481841.1 anion transporter [Meiothermus sp.]
MEYLAYGVLFLTYLGLGLGYWPGYRMNRAAIAITGAALLIVLGVLDFEGAWRALEPHTLGFLFGVMVLNAHLGYAGFFQLFLYRMVRLARSPLGLLIWLTFGTGILSALFLNDTIAILFTPLVLTLTRALGLPPVPYLLALAGATNVGSVATLTGNPQNIVVGSLSGIGYLDFALALGPVALLGLLVQVGLLYTLYPAVRSRTPLAPPPPFRFRYSRPLLLKGVVVTLALLAAFLLGYPLAQAALVAAGLLLWSRRLRSERFFSRVDWELLVLFAGLFMVTAAVRELGLLERVAPLVSSPPSLMLVTVGLSNLISNVPAVLLLHPLIPPGDTQGWLLLAAASTLAGNLTLLGSVANLIVAEAARREGHRLGFLEHLRFGLPLTILTVLMAYAWLYR